MRSTPSIMQGELAEWNGGTGIDLESWASCSGSFKLAVGYAEYFWPEFKLLDGYIVRSCTTSEVIEKWSEACNFDRRSVEAVLNHSHLIDIHYHDIENLTEDLLIRLGTVLTEIYEAKLRWQFPERPCTVFFLMPEDRQDYSAYEITFWQKSHEAESEG